MNLYVSKATFLKNLEKDTGVSFSVIDYDNLRDNIQKIAQNDLIEAISTKDKTIIEEKFNEILDINKKGLKDTVSIFFQSTSIENIQATYIYKLYENSAITSLTEKGIIYTQKNHEDAFKLKLIEFYFSEIDFSLTYPSQEGTILNNFAIKGFLSFLPDLSRNKSLTSFNTSDKSYIRANSLSVIDLDDAKRQEIISQFKSAIEPYLIKNKETLSYNESRPYDYYTNYLNHIKKIMNVDLEKVYQKAMEI